MCEEVGVVVDDVKSGDVGPGLGVGQHVIAAVAIVCVGSLAGWFEIRSGSIPGGMSPHVDPPLEASEMGDDRKDFGIGVEVSSDEGGHFGIVVLELGAMATGACVACFVLSLS